jgi:hypothetical protein
MIYFFKYHATWNSRCLIGALTECIKIIKITKNVYILQKLKNLQKLRLTIKNIEYFKWKNEFMDGLPADISSSDLSFFKFAPINSVDM